MINEAENSITSWSTGMLTLGLSENTGNEKLACYHCSKTYRQPLCDVGWSTKNSSGTSCDLHTVVPHILRPQGLARAHAYDRPMTSESGHIEVGFARLWHWDAELPEITPSFPFLCNRISVLNFSLRKTKTLLNDYSPCRRTNGKKLQNNKMCHCCFTLTSFVYH